MFICAEATQHKERATIPRDFPDSWEGYNQYSQTHARTCDSAVYFFPPLYEEWSNQAWKRVSSVCWRVKRDFQNNPLSRWGFFMYCFFYCKIGHFKIAKEVTIIVEILASRMAGPFSGTMHNYCIACPHMWCSCVIIQPLDRSYFVKWNAELLHTRHRSWSDTCK